MAIVEDAGLFGPVEVSLADLDILQTHGTKELVISN